MPTLLLPNEILSMSAQAARRLVEAGDGDGALLYLALLECGGDGDKAANRLHWPGNRLEQAFQGLAALGLAQPPARGIAAQPQEPETAPPEYSRSELAAVLEREGEFKGLYRELERILGRVFSDNDLKCLYTLYDHLALPLEVILLLTAYVVREERRRRGNPTYSPRMPRIQREGFRWKRLGVDTVERAEEYLRRQERVDGREWAVLSAVGVTERRAAVEKEREFIAQWVEAGYSDELIRLAYERTVYQKGGMNWPYANKILQSWRQSGYRTPEQVQAGDKPVRRQLSWAGRKPEDNYQPSQERIQKNADWLAQFLKQHRGEG